MDRKPNSEAKKSPKKGPPKRVPTGDLTPKQIRFVEEYLIDFNGTQAAIRVGYAKNSAHVQASYLLRNPKIRQAIEGARARLAETSEVTKEGLIKTLAIGLQEASAKQNFAGMGRLAELLARLHGYIVDQKVVRKVFRVEDLSDEELAAMIANAEQRNQDRQFH